MRQDVDEGVFGFRIAGLGRPVTDDFHVMLLEDRRGVVAEASLERLQFAVVRGVDTQLEDAVFRESETSEENSRDEESSKHGVQRITYGAVYGNHPRMEPAGGIRVQLNVYFFF